MTMCIGILNAAVSRYLCGGSAVHGCLIDASKAFDTVDHILLLEKLIARNLPIGVTRFIRLWYQSQQLRVRWKATLSEPFSVMRGVRKEVCSHLFCFLWSYLDWTVDWIAGLD